MYGSMTHQRATHREHPLNTNQLPPPEDLCYRGCHQEIRITGHHLCCNNQQLQPPQCRPFLQWLPYKTAPKLWPPPQPPPNVTTALQPKPVSVTSTQESTLLQPLPTESNQNSWAPPLPQQLQPPHCQPKPSTATTQLQFRSTGWFTRLVLKNKINEPKLQLQRIEQYLQLEEKWHLTLVPNIRPWKIRITGSLSANTDGSQIFT